MPANVGQMFWSGETPWHGEGHRVSRPLSLEEAMREGDLDWEVFSVPLSSGKGAFEGRGPHRRSSPARAQKVLVRSGREPGDPRRVVGVVPDRFDPLQNRDGIEAFDLVFGGGMPVYETGGWLGNGERVWLLARGGDLLEPLRGGEAGRFILFANSHDGSTGIRVRRTGVRVVCQETFALALGERTRWAELRLGHSATPRALHLGLKGLQTRWTKEEKGIAAVRFLAGRQGQSGAASILLDQLFPIPKRPAAGASRGVIASFERHLIETEEAWRRVRETGRPA